MSVTKTLKEDSQSTYTKPVDVLENDFKLPRQAAEALVESVLKAYKADAREGIEEKLTASMAYAQGNLAPVIATWAGRNAQGEVREERPAYDPNSEDPQRYNPFLDLIVAAGELHAHPVLDVEATGMTVDIDGLVSAYTKVNGEYARIEIDPQASEENRLLVVEKMQERAVWLRNAAAYAQAEREVIAAEEETMDFEVAQKIAALAGGMFLGQKNAALQAALPASTTGQPQEGEEEGQAKSLEDHKDALERKTRAQLRQRKANVVRTALDMHFTPYVTAQNDEIRSMLLEGKVAEETDRAVEQTKATGSRMAKYVTAGSLAIALLSMGSCAKQGWDYEAAATQRAAMHQEALSKQKEEADRVVKAFEDENAELTDALRQNSVDMSNITSTFEAQIAGKEAELTALRDIVDEARKSNKGASGRMDGIIRLEKERVRREAEQRKLIEKLTEQMKARTADVLPAPGAAKPAKRRRNLLGNLSTNPVK